ncbi:unnamed protein product, partial [Ascophyllum nodosum]
SLQHRPTTSTCRRHLPCSIRFLTSRKTLRSGMKWFKIAMIAALCYIKSGAHKITIEHAFTSGTNFSPRGTMDLIIGSEGPPSATVPPVNLGSDAPQLESLIAKNELYLIRVATDETSTRHIVAA